MRKFKIALMVLVCSNSLLHAQDYPIQNVPFTNVTLTDKFWTPRIETNRTVTIPASFERCQNTGRIQNFLNAATKTGKFCTKFPFDDTDIYKTIEGASFSLANHPDKKLELYLDSLITIVGNAQEPDGYLYTARTIDPLHPHAWSGMQRWEKERELSHELYNSGHLYEAAVAHFQATKKRNFLDIAIRNADLVCSVFGPGKLAVAPGHEIVEMGLVKLYRITGKKEYLSTAKFFIEQRGHYPKYNTTSKDEWKNGKYWQDDKPVTEQDEAEGHAVRAGYLYSAMADVAALTKDDSLLKAIDRIWENMVSKKLYVQGSVGAVAGGERFGENYELPNATAYNETCAAIANVYWNHRMFLLHGDSKYIDVLEKSLYNGLLSGIGLDGKSFFYTNAMQITNGYAGGGAFNSFNSKSIEPTRSGWFECSCCPTNMARLLPSIPGYMYAVKDGKLYVNLFINSNAYLTIGKQNIELTQQNNYPWDGGLVFNVNPETTATFNMMIRIPGWAQNEAVPSDLYKFANNDNEKVTITVNGKPVSYKITNGYANINRTWKKNDMVKVNLPMPVRKVIANQNLKDDIGKVALQRGPMMYCAEWPDNNGTTSSITIPAKTTFNASFTPNLLNGVMVLTNKSTQKPFITAIPYYSWANRGKGEMQVWFPEK
ncbi:MAG: glycoside hydrolase family 127 protein [Mucilaginibacter sp.]|uniref:glycoside hydrolase family 127 protein n=1 Tax=Mucilaginibacter sp. TaxID=1882438 RepID=UPI003264D6FE